MYVVVSGILIPYIRCVPLKSFMKNVLRKRVEENRWTSLGYLMTFPSFHLKVKMQQFWKSEPSKFQQVQHIHQEYPNLWLIVSPHWLCLRMWKKLTEVFPISGTSTKFLPWFLWYYKNMNADWMFFPSGGPLLGSLPGLAAIFTEDGEILFLLNPKVAFFLLYPSSFSTVRSSPQDTMKWLCGITGLNCWPCNDSSCEISRSISRSIFCHQETDCCEKVSKHLSLHWKQLQVFLKFTH